MFTYIKETALPTIPESDEEDLEAQILSREFLQVIKGLKNGNSPSPGTPRFYKTFASLLALVMVKGWELSTASNPISSSMMQAQITVIPKPGKDHFKCGNYRPISLLNVDLKLSSNIIVKCIPPLIPDIIHRDQVGFAPGRETIRLKLPSHLLL